MANLRGLIFGILSNKLSISWVQALTVSVSALVLLAVALLRRGKFTGFDAFVLAITTSLVVSYYLGLHDLVLLLIPLLVVLCQSIKVGEHQAPGYRLSAWLAGVLFVAPMCWALAVIPFYVVSVPLIAFLVVLVFRQAASENQTLSSPTSRKLLSAGCS